MVIALDALYRDRASLRTSPRDGTAKTRSGDCLSSSFIGFNNPSTSSRVRNRIRVLYLLASYLWNIYIYICELYPYYIRCTRPFVNFHRNLHPNVACLHRITKDEEEEDGVPFSVIYVTFFLGLSLFFYPIQLTLISHLFSPGARKYYRTA